MEHEKFYYKTLEDVKKRAQELNIHLPFIDNTKILAVPVKAGTVILQNRLGVAPMEGAD